MNQAFVLSLLLTANADYVKMGHAPIIKKYSAPRLTYRRKPKYHGNHKYQKALHRTSGADRAHFQR